MENRYPSIAPSTVLFLILSGDDVALSILSNRNYETWNQDRWFDRLAIVRFHCGLLLQLFDDLMLLPKLQQTFAGFRMVRSVPTWSFALVSLRRSERHRACSSDMSQNINILAITVYHLLVHSFILLFCQYVSFAHVCLNYAINLHRCIFLFVFDNTNVCRLPTN